MHFRSRTTLQGTLITLYNMHMLYNAQVTAVIAKLQFNAKSMPGSLTTTNQLRTCLVRVNTSSGQP